MVYACLNHVSKILKNPDLEWDPLTIGRTAFAPQGFPLKKIRFLILFFLF